MPITDKNPDNVNTQAEAPANGQESVGTRITNANKGDSNNVGEGGRHDPEVNFRANPTDISGDAPEDTPHDDHPDGFQEIHQEGRRSQRPRKPPKRMDL